VNENCHVLKKIKIVDDGADGVITKKVKITIELNMANQPNYHGRVGFVAEQLEENSLEKILVGLQKQ
jgi:hypothetical protein